MEKTFFITGTGTGIGKTFSTGVLAGLASNAGKKVAVMKPVQTGLNDPWEGDIGQVARMVPGALKLPGELACPYCLHFESSPHLAAQKEKIEIRFETILERYRTIQSSYTPDLTLLEGAGGLMVPIDRKRMMIDLIAFLNFPVILIADAGLGTINHTLLSLNELHRRGIPVAGFCINRLPRNPGEIELDNILMLKELTDVPLIAVISESPENAPVVSEFTPFWK